MKKLATLLFFLSTFFLFPFNEARANAGGPTILKRTISVTARRYSRYWKNPKAAEPVYNTYAWAPIVSFELLGAVPAGSQWQVEFSMPDGKPWFTYDLFTRELGDDEFGEIKMTENINFDEHEKRAILPTGLFPFKIILKNELQGKTDVMFAGKYKVATYTPDQNIPDFKGKKEFYVDHDWMLPIGYLWLNPEDNEAVPNVSAQMTFRGRTNEDQMQAFMFYNGKKLPTQALSRIAFERSNSAGEPHSVYYTWQFTFAQVRARVSDDSSNFTEAHFIEKNPGQYEIRVLRNGELSRTLAFTVGKDGKIADNGIAKNNQLGGIRMVFPVKIVTDPITAWDKTAWQTGLYNNPLAGFTAVQ